ncbi:MAG: hypothetical protein ACOY3F_03455 [Bacillota bacterium]
MQLAGLGGASARQAVGVEPGLHVPDVPYWRPKYRDGRMREKALRKKEAWAG